MQGSNSPICFESVYEMNVPVEYVHMFYYNAVFRLTEYMSEFK